MNMVVKGRHMDVRPELRDYAEQKINKVAKILNHLVMDIEIELYQEHNPSIENKEVAEVTIFTKHPGPIIRGREAAFDMHAAIDLVAAKLERQALRVKGKLDRKNGRHTLPAGPVAVEAEEIGLGRGSEAGEEEAESFPAEIVRRKRLDLKPMAPEEAILQIELLGHDFYVFRSSETDDLAVLYKRRGGGYGLIEPRMT